MTQQFYSVLEVSLLSFSVRVVHNNDDTMVTLVSGWGSVNYPRYAKKTKKFTLI